MEKFVGKRERIGGGVRWGGKGGRNTLSYPPASVACSYSFLFKERARSHGVLLTKHERLKKVTDKSSSNQIFK